jgi:hypothetical protein
MPRVTLILLVVIATACGACRQVPTTTRAVFSGDSSPAGVRAMVKKCRRVTIGMTHCEVDALFGFQVRSERLPDGREVEEWAFGVVEKGGGAMRIVYGMDGRVQESHLQQW